MYFFLTLFALTQACGIYVLIRAKRSAPAGYEDDTGFYFNHPIGATLKPRRMSKVKVSQ